MQQNTVACQPVKEVHAFYGALEVRHSVHNSPTFVSILSQINPVHILPSNFFKIHFNLSFNLCLDLPSGLFTSDLPIKTLHSFALLPTRATCPSTP